MYDERDTFCSSDLGKTYRAMTISCLEKKNNLSVESVSVLTRFIFDSILTICSHGSVSMYSSNSSYII